MKKKKEVVIDTTPLIRSRFSNFTILRDSLDKVLKGTIFNRPSMAEKLEYMQAMAHARSEMWEIVYKEYPMLLGKEVNLSETKITYDR